MPMSPENIIKINTESSNLLAGNLDMQLHEKFNAFSMQFLSLNILHRIVFYQRSLNPLLKELYTNEAFEFPIALLLRAACLDILQYGYIMKCLDSLPLENATSDSIQKDIQPKIIKSLQNIYCDNLKNQISDWKCLKDVGELKNMDYELLISNLKQEYYSFFPGDSPQNCKSLSARDLYKKLKQNKKYDVFSDLFSHYAYYSKFEHFGILSYSFTRPSVKSLDDLLLRVSHIVVVMMKVSQIGLMFLSADRNDLLKYDEWLDKLLK